MALGGRLGCSLLATLGDCDALVAGGVLLAVAEGVLGVKLGVGEEGGTTTGALALANGALAVVSEPAALGSVTVPFAATVLEGAALWLGMRLAPLDTELLLSGALIACGFSSEQPATAVPK